MNKRDLQRLEGLLLLTLLHKTKNKRLSASIIGISVDTLTKYIKHLENDLETQLLLNHKNSCKFTSTANEILLKLQNLDIENWKIENKKIDMFDLKNTRGIFYLKAISLFGNKRNASQKLATSIETINLYVDYLQNSLQTALIQCDTQGSYLTNEGASIVFRFDRVTKFINTLVKQKSYKNKTIRLAIDTGINISINSCNDLHTHDIVVFTDNPNLHFNEWDIAISFSKPQSDNLVVDYKRKINCGFFASVEYLRSFGTPKNLDDLKKNHIVLDGRTRPYANKDYCDFVDDCQNTRFIDNSSIAILDMVRYGVGICLAPVTIPRNNLVYLEHLMSPADATLYLTIHKPFNNVLKYRQAMSDYRNLLSSI